MNAERQNRILWLLPEAHLQDVEVPLLERLGFDVFIPAGIAATPHNRESRQGVERPLLDKLDRFDFASFQYWPRGISENVNKTFDMVFAPSDPALLRILLNSFSGLIILRTCGYAGNASLAQQFERELPKADFTRFKQADHIYLAAGLDILIDDEPHWLRQKCLLLPLGISPQLDNSLRRNEDNHHILLISSDKTPSSSEKRKRMIGKPLENLPLTCLDEQDCRPSSSQFVRYQTALRTAALLYCPANGKREFPLYILDALAGEVPLLFNAGGLLEYLAKGEHPGCCISLEEVREKAAALLNGDRELRSGILSAQKKMRTAFELKTVEKIWRENLLPVLERSAAPSARPAQSGNPDPFGIWMHVHIPGSLTGEGISHLMAMIIKGAQRSKQANLKVHIACVSWIKQDVIDFLRDEGLDPDTIDFEMAGKKPPFLYRFYHWWTQRKPREKKESLFWRNFEEELGLLIGYALDRVLTVRTLPGLILIGLALLCVSPVLLLLILVYVLVKLLDTLLTDILRLINQVPIVMRCRGWVHHKQNRINKIAPAVYQRMLKTEFQQLAEKVGKDRRFKAWFFAYPNNPNIDQFTTPRVVAVPDVVYLDFPNLYSGNPYKLIDHPDNHIFETIRKADTVVTFSETIRERHVVRPGLQPAEHVRVIPHAPIDKLENLTARKEISEFDLRYIAGQVMRAYIDENLAEFPAGLRDYLQNLDPTRWSYLFVSSQTRPHKNHLNVLKAYCGLLREKYINQKLVFTGRFSSEMAQFIKEERLQLDVLSFNSLPSRVHAAFYACASLTVTPTLFEGGFPFTFSESLSVGTPIVLSDIPVTREVLTDQERQSYCFDPYDIQAMMDKIAWALEHREQLLKEELKTLEKMKARTWEDVASDYLRVFLSADTRSD